MDGRSDVEDLEMVHRPSAAPFNETPTRSDNQTSGYPAWGLVHITTYFGTANINRKSLTDM